jgi:hypothetical protein
VPGAVTPHRPANRQERIMSYADPTTTTRTGADTSQPARHDRRNRRISTETKSAFKTTEFLVYVLAVAGVLIASYLVKSHAGHPDIFRADKAWFYVVLLTIGYLGSRGLAKSGSRDYDD